MDQGEKIGLMVIEKAKKNPQKTWKGQTALTSQFYLTSLAPTHSSAKRTLSILIMLTQLQFLLKTKTKTKKSF